MVNSRAREVIQLPPDVKRELEEQIPKMEAIHDALATMRELGMDTTDIEGHLDWAEKAAKLMLKEFG